MACAEVPGGDVERVDISSGVAADCYQLRAIDGAIVE